jgi:hypothetical protein
MANYSIPNSTPAIGRTSTPLSRRLRKQNSREPASSITHSRAASSSPRRIRPAADCRTPRRAARKKSGRTIALSPFRPFAVSFLLRRVTGAWWSSRSSKPLSVPHTRDRGRFDSYPLRNVSCNICSRFAARNARVATGRRLQQPHVERR